MTSALGWLMPRHQRAGAGHLPRLLQAAQERVPGTSRLPIPEEMVLALVMTAVFILRSRGEPINMALALLVAHHCYLRPAELCRLTWAHVSLGAGQARERAALTLRPFEQCRASKTGEFDETVIVDLAFLVAAMRRLKACRPPHELLVPLGVRRLAALFDDA